MNGRVVPVLTVESADDAERACEAILAGGLTSVEITFRTDPAVEAIRRASQIDGLSSGPARFSPRRSSTAAVDAGAQFAVTPSTNESWSALLRGQASSSCPGRRRRPRSIGRRLSAAESSSCFRRRFSAARRSSRRFRLSSPIVRFVPTGGVNPDNLAEYLRLPSVGACGGTWICEPALIRDGRFDEIERRAREASRLVPA